MRLASRAWPWLRPSWAVLPRPRADLRIGLQEDPDILDPHRARTFVGRIVFTSLCDKLIDITPELKLVAAARDRVVVSDDGQTLTMKLRDDATFHDGAKFDAEAVKANIERARTLPTRCGERARLGRERRGGRPDDRRLQPRAPRCDAPGPARRPRRHDDWRRSGLRRASARSRSARAPTGSSSACRTTASCSRSFHEHWDADEYPLRPGVFLPIPDTTVRLANLRAGDLDMMERLAADRRAAGAGRRRASSVASVIGIGYQGITINIANGERGEQPAGPGQARAPGASARDRPQRHQPGRVRGRVSADGSQPFPPASPYYDQDLPVPPRDVAKAKALLKEAGHETVELRAPVRQQQRAAAGQPADPGDGGRGRLRDQPARHRVRRHAGRDAGRATSR